MVPKKHELFRKKEVIKMIEFKGDLSKECRDYILNVNQIIGMIAATIATMPFTIAAIVLTFKYKTMLYLLELPVSIQNLKANYLKR